MPKRAPGAPIQIDDASKELQIRSKMQCEYQKPVEPFNPLLYVRRSTPMLDMLSEGVGLVMNVRIEERSALSLAFLGSQLCHIQWTLEFKQYVPCGHWEDHDPGLSKLPLALTRFVAYGGRGGNEKRVNGCRWFPVVDGIFFWCFDGKGQRGGDRRSFPDLFLSGHMTGEAWRLL